MGWLVKNDLTLDAAYSFTPSGGFRPVQPFVHWISSTRLVLVFRGDLTDPPLLFAWGGDVASDGVVSMDAVGDAVIVAELGFAEFPIRVWSLPDGGYYVETEVRAG